MRISLLALLILALPARAEEAKNLLPNGDFTEGRDGNPAHWDPMDGLCTFWVKDPVRGGMCLKTDSAIKQDVYDKRREEMKKPNPPPMKPGKYQSSGYDAVGGDEGVPVFSDFIEAKQGMKYRLSIDYRTDKEFAGKGLSPKVFVKAYGEWKEDIWKDGKVVKGNVQRRVFWKQGHDCKGCEEAWKTTTLDFNPTRGHDGIKWLRVMTFTYWPAGTCYFTNVKITELGPEPVAQKPKEGKPIEDDDVKPGPADGDGLEVVPPQK